MRNTYSGEYSTNWIEIAIQAKDAAGWRCVRCLHPFAPDTGSPLLCDQACDIEKGIHRKVGGRDPRARAHDRVTVHTMALLEALNYGIHHFDGDKSNNRWWNLMALCNSCHLKIQSSVVPERVWLFQHSTWAQPYVGGFYAYWYAKREVTREEVERDVDLFLALGQPWLYPERAEQVRAVITHGFLAETVRRNDLPPLAREGESPREYLQRMSRLGD